MAFSQDIFQHDAAACLYPEPSCYRVAAGPIMLDVRAGDAYVYCQC